MRYSFTILLAIFLGVGYGQGFTYPSVPSKGRSMADFVPAGWLILDSARGDLNRDGLPDAAIVIQPADSVLPVNNLQDTVLTQPRILLILFKDRAGNGFELAEQSNSFILNHDNAVRDDPFQQLAIGNGMLTVTFRLFYSIGNWYITNAVYRFRYQGGQFVLAGADKYSFHRATHDFEEYSYNFLTRASALATGNENKGTRKTTRRALAVSPLKTLRTFTEPFTWQVEAGVYL